MTLCNDRRGRVPLAVASATWMALACLAASLACACWTRQRGAVLFRVHDVAETVRALRMTEALEAGRSG